MEFDSFTTHARSSFCARAGRCWGRRGHLDSPGGAGPYGAVREPPYMRMPNLPPPSWDLKAAGCGQHLRLICPTFHWSRATAVKKGLGLRVLNTCNFASGIGSYLSLSKMPYVGAIKDYTFDPNHQDRRQSPSQ